MIDKLASIQKKNRTLSYQQAPKSAQVLTMQTQSPRETSYTGEGVQQEFSQNITKVRAMVNRIKQNNLSIQTIKRKYEQAIKSQQEKGCSTQIQKILDQNTLIHKKIKNVINSLSNQVNNCDANPKLRDQPETKMKRNMLMAVSKQVAEILQEQRSQEDAFKTTVKKKVTRQVKIIDPTLDQQQLQHYANNPSEAAELLTKKVGLASVHLRNAVQDIQDKYRDIQRLQRSVNQCLQLFKQMSQMIYQQGQQIDNIEMHCQDAKDYVQKADKQLISAKKKQQCKKKCCCWSIIIGIIVGVILIAVVIPIAIKSVKPI